MRKLGEEKKFDLGEYHEEAFKSQSTAAAPAQHPTPPSMASLPPEMQAYFKTLQASLKEKDDELAALKQPPDLGAPFFFLVNANWLKLVCFEAHEWHMGLVDQLKDRSHLFLSHSPSEPEFVKSKLYQQLELRFNMHLHRRVKLKAREKEKGVDVDLGACTIECVDHHEKMNGGQKGTVVIVSSDADYKPLVKRLRNRGWMVRVWAWSANLSEEYQRWLTRSTQKRGSPQLRLLDHVALQIGHPSLQLTRKLGDTRPGDTDSVRINLAPKKTFPYCVRFEPAKITKQQLSSAADLNRAVESFQKQLETLSHISVVRRCRCTEIWGKSGLSAPSTTRYTGRDTPTIKPPPI